MLDRHVGKMVVMNTSDHTLPLLMGTLEDVDDEWVALSPYSSDPSDAPLGLGGDKTPENKMTAELIMILRENVVNMTVVAVGAVPAPEGG